MEDRKEEKTIKHCVLAGKKQLELKTGLYNNGAVERKKTNRVFQVYTQHSWMVIGNGHK